jgi:predicted acyltransferase
MAIPFAINKRLERGDSLLNIWKNILVRTTGLLVLGVYMVNIHGLNSSATGISKSLWMLLLFIAVIFVWNVYPKSEGWKRITYIGFRGIGIVVLIWLAAIYRSGEGENIGWMHTSWWGILGLIGWSYLVCSAVYLAFRKHLSALVGMLGLFTLLYIADKTGSLDFLYLLKQNIFIGGHIGGHSSITAAGMIVAMVFLQDSAVKSNKEKIVWTLIFALMMAVAAYFLRPLYGINKVAATPSWCLYCSAICAVIFVFLYWMVDLKGIVRWAKVIMPAGVNPLLAYILPDIFYALLGIFGVQILSEYFGSGMLGIIRSTVIAFTMVGLTAVMTWLNVRLHL